MDAKTLEFWQQYNRPPAVIAVMPARIVGKAVSAHPGQPVMVTLETILPDGAVMNLPLIFPNESDAEHIPETVTIDPVTQERKYSAPLEVYLLVCTKPDLSGLTTAEYATDENAKSLSGDSTTSGSTTDSTSGNVASQPEGDAGTGSAG